MNVNASTPPMLPAGPPSGAHPLAGSSRFKPIDPLSVLRQHVWLLVGLVVLGVGCGAGTWYLLRTFNPWYSSSALVNITPINPGAWSGLGDEMRQMRLDAVQAALENEQLRLRSEQTLRAAMGRSMLRDTPWFASFTTRDGETVDTHAAMRTLRDRMLRTRVVPGSTQMEVSVRTARPGDAQPILAAVLETYVSRVRAEREDESRGVRQVYLDERARAQQEIERISEQLERFPRETRMASLETELEDAQVVRRELAGEYMNLQLSLDQARQQQRMLQQQEAVGELEPTARAMQEIEAAGALQRLDQRLQALRTERNRLQARLGPEHHRIRDIEGQIAATETEKQQATERILRERRAAELEYAAQAVNTIESRLTRLEPKLEEARLRVQDLKERLAEYQDGYDRLREQLRQVRQAHQRYDEQLTALRVQSTRPDAVRAQVWSAPSSPRLASPKAATIIPAVTLLVIGLGTGGLFLKETLDQRIKTPADVRLIARTDLLGVVPDAQEDLSGSGRIEHAVAQHPAGLLAEAFRQVRTALVGKMARHGYKSLLIAGGQPGAGASAVAHNLACSLIGSGAAEDRRVLLIDANIRRPAQHTLHDLPQSPGLVELLQGLGDPTRAVMAVEGSPLEVLPVGDLHEASPELFAGPALRKVLDQLEARYDVIVIDAPPALLSSDTPLLARHVDAMALIVRSDRDQRGMVERMVRQLEGHRASLLGLILNGAHSSAGGYFRESYREFYRYNPTGQAQRNGHVPKRPSERTPQPQPEHQPAPLNGSEESSTPAPAPVPPVPSRRGQQQAGSPAG